MKSSARVGHAVMVLATSAWLLASVPALAQSEAPAPRARAEVSRQAVEQKIAMIDRLLFSSPLSARVGGSSSEDAKRHFTNARELLTHARGLTTTGQLRGADALLNEAIWEIGRAQTLAPDQGARLAEERARYLDDACRGKPELRQRVEALLRAHEEAGAG